MKVSQDYDLVSHTTYVVCVYFTHEWRNQQFKADSGQQISKKLVVAIFIYSQSFFFIFPLPEDVWPWGLNQGLTSNKPTHYLLDYGNIQYTMWLSRVEGHTEAYEARPIRHSVSTLWVQLNLFWWKNEVHIQWPTINNYVEGVGYPAFVVISICATFETPGFFLF